MKKIAIIGCGKVGMSYLIGLIQESMGLDEIILIDKDQLRTEGEVLDLRDALAFCPQPCCIRQGTLMDCQDASLVVFTVGMPQNFKSRLDDAQQAGKMLEQLTKQVMETGFQGIFLVASNPVDLMTEVVFRTSGLDHHQVIGTGTSLDTARLRMIVSSLLKKDPHQLEAYVIGEHGDSQVVVWSQMKQFGKPLILSSKEQKQIEEEVRSAAYHIIEKKQATSYGIGRLLTVFTKALLTGQEILIPASVYHKEDDLYISSLAIIGKGGLMRKVPLSLTEDEQKRFQQSKMILKKAWKKIP